MVIFVSKLLPPASAIREKGAALTRDFYSTLHETKSRRESWEPALTEITTSTKKYMLEIFNFKKITKKWYSYVTCSNLHYTLRRERVNSVYIILFISVFPCECSAMVFHGSCGNLVNIVNRLCMNIRCVVVVVRL